MRWTFYASDVELEALADECPEAAFELRVRAIHAIGRQYNEALRAIYYPDPPDHKERMCNASYLESFL